MPDRPDDQVDINPATVAHDRILDPLSELLAYLDLHLGRYHWKVLTTTQKEMLADLIDSAHVNHPGGGPDEAPWFVPRWWREDWVEPDYDDHTHAEPDPFKDRPSTPDPYDRPSRRAFSLARHVTLGSSSDPDVKLEEQLAVYEWALRNRTPFWNSAGHIVPGHALYPSVNQARAFLAEYRRRHHQPGPNRS